MYSISGVRDHPDCDDGGLHCSSKILKPEGTSDQLVGCEADLSRLRRLNTNNAAISKGAEIAEKHGIRVKSVSG